MGCLSPRVRGNHLRGCCDPIGNMSIPACAGEPPCAIKVPFIGIVYPRVCGGTLSSLAISCSPGCLSPRVRGNPGSVAPSTSERLSIPACAGEPSDVSNL